MICKNQHTFMGVKCISIPSNSFIRPGDKGGFVLVVDFPHYMDVVVPNLYALMTQHGIGT